MCRNLKLLLLNLFRSIYILLIILLFSSSVLSQNKDTSKSENFKYSISIGMGISLTNNPSLNDYLKNVLPFKSKDSVKTWNIGLGFIGGIEYKVAKKFSLKLEYTYFTRSINYNYSYLIFDYFTVVHKPGIMVYYLINGKNFQFKIGSGFSAQFAKFERDLGSNNVIKYTSNGFGYKGELAFEPKLSKRLGVNIAGFVIAEKLSSLKDQNNNLLIDPVSKNEVNLSDFGVGVSIGLSYNF